MEQIGDLHETKVYAETNDHPIELILEYEDEIYFAYEGLGAFLLFTIEEMQATGPTEKYRNNPNARCERCKHSFGQLFTHDPSLQELNACTSCHSTLRSKFKHLCRKTPEVTAHNI